MWGGKKGGRGGERCYVGTAWVAGPWEREESGPDEVMGGGVKRSRKTVRSRSHR